LTILIKYLMADFPQTLDEAVAQAIVATQAAIAAGYRRLSVELALPELKPLPVAYQYLPALEAYGDGLKIFFSDAGTAALVKRDWADMTLRTKSVDVAGARQTSTIEELVEPADQAFLFVAPTAVEVRVVEQICDAVGDLPVVLFCPRLEDVGTVGIGYTARQMRSRFLSTIEPCYYLRPLSGAALLRNYPSPWQIWEETEAGYSLLAEEPLRPSGERIDEILMKSSLPQAGSRNTLFSGLQRFLKALGQ